MEKLRAEVARLKELRAQDKRTLGGTNAALTRARAKASRLEDELAAARLRIGELEDGRTCTAELNEQRDAVVCSACGSSMILRGWTEMLDWGRTPRISSFTTYPYCPNCGARVIGGTL